jgi:Icc-related predicted phosphoesterase
VKDNVKLLAFSDLHLEHKPDWALPESFPPFDVCIAAGDISGSPAESIRLLAAHPGLAGKPIVFVAGNHEFYHSVLEDEVEKGKAAAAETGVNYLDGTSVVIDGTRFVGATLWSDYSVLGNRALGMSVAASGMNDHRLIKRRAYTPGHPGKWRFLPQDAAWHHAKQRAAIERILAEPFDGATVVVSHHAPSRQSIHPRNLGNALNVAYASDLESVLKQWKPTLFLHGHIHDSVNFTVGSTTVRSNPKGYGPHLSKGMPFIENPAFNPRLIIEVPIPAQYQEPQP